MSANRLTFSNSLKAKDLCYSDEFFKLKSEKVIPSDSFTFDSYEAFKDINDFKTNNYSNLFLINKQKNSDWLEPQIRQKDQMNGLATTISWYSAKIRQGVEEGSWLYFSKNYQMFDINVSEVDAILTYGKPDKNYSNYIFYLEFLDENTCRISHTFGDLTFYLAVEEDKTIKFVKNPQDDKQKFIYVLDGEMVKLYKRIQHKNYDQRGDVTSKYNKLYLLGIKRNQEKQATLKVWQETQLDTADVVIYVTNNLLDFDFYVNSSWVSYDRSKYISSIDAKRSAYNLTTQALIHHQYNKEEGFNFIPLKNNQTYKGNRIRGNNMTYSNQYYPDVDFRTYTSINSGFNQEKGTDNITLTFNFTDQQYVIQEGQDIVITIPQKSLETTNGLQPLWPYKYININDTKFIKNGSFGSNVPFFADKVKKLQGHKTLIKDSQGNKLSPNNGTYLCSWLYKKNQETKPIWLDRYYYPDMISRHEALDGLSNYQQSFENIIDKAYIADLKQLSQDATPQQKQEWQKKKKTINEIKGKIHRNTYFDKVSDLVIEPGNDYIYHRISQEMIDQVNEKLQPHRISSGLTKQKNSSPIDELFWFDNQNYFKLNYKDWNKTNAINYNMDIYLARDKKMGIQIFGTDYKDGFNIQNRKDLVPFHYWASDTTIYMLNNKYEVVRKFDLYQKYEDNILKVFYGDVFDDVVVVSGIWMYIFSYDLSLKSRIDMTASESNGKANGIKDLENISIFENETQFSKQYDYSQKIENHKTVNHEQSITHAQWEQGVQIGCPHCIAMKQPEKPKNNDYSSVSMVNYPYGHTGIYLSSNYKKEEPIEIPITQQWSIDLNERYTSSTKIYIDENTVFSGFVVIPSFLSEYICKYTPILYKNNLYIPVNQRIMKIIFCPDSEHDFEYFNEQDMGEYPAAARYLTSDEFFLNYTKKGDGQETDSLSTQQGFIQVENKIKHIFINEDGKIFGLNYDEYSISSDGDTIYGLYATQKYLASGGWFWIFNDSLSKMQSDTSTNKYAEWASPNSIDRILFNTKGEMCLIRNFRNAKDNENEDNNKRMDIYDKTKKRIYTYDLSPYEQIVTFDSFSYIDEIHKQQTVFVLTLKALGSIYKVTYFSNSKSISSTILSVPYEALGSLKYTGNSNTLLRYRDTNALYFNLHIPSHYTYDYIATIKWDISDIQQGWYNINAMVDLDSAQFQVRINDIILETINEKTHSWFKPYVSSNGTVFDSTYYIGIIGKKYGTLLNNITKNAPYDPYVCKNSKIDNLNIHNKRLDYYEYQAMRMKGKAINRLILTLPCGNRNGIDEIIRYFKYNSSPSISNKVKINITGTGLKTQGQFNMLRNEIQAVLHNNMDCLIDVKDIEFVQLNVNDEQQIVQL